MMGAEPYIAALEGGADVVLAGRSSDTAIFASVPISLGFPEGLAWHAAKILECGAAAATHRKAPDCIMATIGRDDFVIEPLDPELRCTPQSIAAHSLYENADPFLLREPGGTLDIREASYQAVDSRAVRVRGSRFVPAPQYTVKLEGAELVGHQSAADRLGARPVHHPPDRRLAGAPEREDAREGPGRLRRRARQPLASDRPRLRQERHDGPLEPVKESQAHELCLLFRAVAPDADTALAIASMTRHQALHLPIPEWSGLITGVACPVTPSYHGPMYRFNVNHVVEVDDPLELFRIEHVDVH